MEGARWTCSLFPSFFLSFLRSFFVRMQGDT